MISYFCISNIIFSVDYPEDISLPVHFALFEISKEGIQGNIPYSYRITMTSSPILEGDVDPEWDLVAKRDDIRVYKKVEYEMRLLAARGREGFYARYEEISEGRFEIILDESYGELFAADTVFSSLFALEKRASQMGDLVLHCAYMEHQDEGILFSAPSGVGKSTQAALWEKYRGSHVQNGDRALLAKKDGVWYACGWPVCGSSEICNNSSHPIKTIVTLSQEKENSVTELSPMQAFSKLYSEITVNSWDRAASVRAMDNLEALITSVPVYHLGCDISEDAVRCLEKTIYPA